MIMKKYTIVLMIFLGGVMNAFAQTPQPTAGQDNYTQVITQRSNKIVTALNISDSVKFKRVRDIIVDQYRNLNDIYNDRNAKSKVIGRCAKLVRPRSGLSERQRRRNHRFAGSQT